MTHAHAARMLLAHGPLTIQEFIEITGWKNTQVYKTLYWLVSKGQVCFWHDMGVSPRRYHLSRELAPYASESLTT